MENFRLLFKGIYEGLGSFGRIVSGIVNFFLLLIIYLLGIGLVSLIFKFRKKKFLSLGWNSELKSYWADSPILHRKKGDYFKPF